jgi:hypothetical protein
MTTSIFRKGKLFLRTGGPDGIYDMQANKGYITIGNSAETADFVIDNLRWWWTEHGIHLYPDATNMLLLCDAGGANSYRHHIFKDRLIKLATELGMSFIICHYPPYTSKWNGSGQPSYRTPTFLSCSSCYKRCSFF